MNRTPEDAYGNYFEQPERFSFSVDGIEGKYEFTTKVSTSADELVRSFYHFMLGAGFHYQSVLSAFETIHQEYSEK